jgi:replicative DNA helicase
MIDRLPPHCPDDERGILACCLMDPQSCIGQVVEAFPAGAETFFDLRHQAIFAALAKMWDDRIGVDSITLCDHLRAAKVLDDVGGAAYVDGLHEAAPSALNLPYYLPAVKGAWMARQMLRALVEGTQALYEPATGEDWDGTLDRIEQAVMAVRAAGTRDGEDAGIASLVREAINSIEARWARGDGLIGLSTGLTDLDRATGGLAPGELTIIAAYPSVGKTSLAMNIADAVAITQGLPVAVFSFEMTAARLVERLLASRARLNLRRMSEAVGQTMTDLRVATTTVAKSKLHVISRQLTISQVRAKARRLWAQHGIRLVIVDYVQLVESGAAKGANREQEVAAVCLGLKNLAQELGIHVISMSQLNDDGKLRESRTLTQHPDNVWILKERSVDEKATSPAPVREVDLLISKQRDGGRGFSVPLTFFAEFTLFRNSAKVQDDETPTTPIPTSKPKRRYANNQD